MILPSRKQDREDSIKEKHEQQQPQQWWWCQNCKPVEALEEIRHRTEGEPG